MSAVCLVCVCVRAGVTSGKLSLFQCLTPDTCYYVSVSVSEVLWSMTPSAARHTQSTGKPNENLNFWHPRRIQGFTAKTVFVSQNFIVNPPKMLPSLQNEDFERTAVDEKVYICFFKWFLFSVVWSNLNCYECIKNLNKDLFSSEVYLNIIMISNASL